jgi:hopanoid biosynthesis associated protein HpnK
MPDNPLILVVVADDFGRSSSVNEAVAEAHDKGIVTSVSIMPGGKGFEEAVLIARRSDRLSTGLHVTLCDGRSVLPKQEIPDLVDGTGHFEKNAARAWLKYSRRALRQQIEREVEAQFDILEKAGITITHVDSHHHLHMHPGIFPLVCGHASARGVRWIRIVHEPISRLFFTGRRGAAPFIEWAVFGCLAARHRRTAEGQGLRFADRVYGLSTTGSLDEPRVTEMLERMNDTGIYEMFVHPVSTTTAGRRELRAITSEAVRRRIVSAGIRLMGYRELNPPETDTGTGKARAA